VSDNVIDFATHKRIAQLTKENEMLKLENSKSLSSHNTSHQSPLIRANGSHPSCSCRTCQLGITSSIYE
jgi:hypothetical protein